MPPKTFVTASLLPPLALALWLALGAGSAHAADDDKRLAQARDAMRRAQQSLQQTQSERSALQRDKAALEAERDRLAAALADAETRQRSSAAQQARLSGSLSGAERQRESTQAELAKERTARLAVDRELQAQQARSAASQQALEEQRRITAATSGLLERSVQALAQAEARNRELLALGTQALEAYLNDTPVAMRARDEPFLGLGRVTLESRAEGLRQAMAAQTTGR